MNKYVLCVYISSYGNVLLLRKNRPDWQKGKLNFPGGKIEDGEDAVNAAEREFLEEIGVIAQAKYAGEISGDWGICYVYKMKIFSQIKICQNDVGETFTWMPIKSVFTEPDVIPNAKLILPYVIIDVPVKIEDNNPWGGPVTISTEKELKYD